MRRSVTRALIGLAVLAYCLGISMPMAAAVTNNSKSKGLTGSGQALEIAPPLINLRADPGQSLKTKVQLRDISSDSLIVTNQINDFVANGEDGTPKILLDSAGNNPFSMKSWVEPLQQLTLKPGQVETVDLKINVPKGASPGGHYAVIRFTGTPPQLKGQGVSLSASLGTLVFLTVNGKLTHNLSLSEFSVNNGGDPGSFFESAPLNFVVRLKNTGNIQEKPTGHIVISDMFGRNIAGVNINLPPHNILPDSTRKFIGKLDHKALGNRTLFGRYHAKITVTYGTDSNQKDKLVKTITFWIIPWKLIIAIIVALIVVFFIFRYLLRRYKRRILKQASGRR